MTSPEPGEAYPLPLAALGEALGWGYAAVWTCRAADPGAEPDRALSAAGDQVTFFRVPRCRSRVQEHPQNRAHDNEQQPVRSGPPPADLCDY